MRILFLLRSAEGGIRTHVEALMRGAQSAGHETLLLTDLARADANFRETLNADPFFRKRVKNVPMRSLPGPWDLLALWTIADHLREHGPFDIVHGHGAKGGLFARVLRLLGVLPDASRVVYTPHGGSLHAMFGFPMNQIYRWVERRLASLTDLLLFESRYSEDVYAKRIGQGLAPSVLNRNGVPELSADLAPWPEGLGRTSPLRIGAFGLLRPIKGFSTLIHAMRRLKRHGFIFELDIFGIGADRDHLEELIQKSELTSYVRLRGDTARALEEMKWRHLIVQPSLFESFGLVALEAQALGKAVIASRVGGLVDVVEDGVTGVLIEPGDYKALVAAVEGIIADPDKTARMRYAAVERARRQFSQEKMIEGALLAYRNVLGTAVETHSEVNA